MIKHHPKFELIQSFVNGDLPASLSAGIAMHADMCPKCQQQIAQLTDQVAEVSFEEAYLDRFIIDEQEEVECIDEKQTDISNIDEMIAQITQFDDIDNIEPNIEKTIQLNDKPYVLPTALNSMSLGKTLHLGKLARSRIQLNENEIHHYDHDQLFH